eukprot:COSAG04_NODE_859_length_9813_cov_35.427836_4_plen_174_part_00
MRFAADPVLNMFSAGMLSVNGTTVSSVAANPADLSLLQMRTEHTKAGAAQRQREGSIFLPTLCDVLVYTRTSQSDEDALAENLAARIANRAEDRLAMASATDKLPSDPSVVGEFAKNVSISPPPTCARWRRLRVAGVTKRRPHGLTRHATRLRTAPEMLTPWFWSPVCLPVLQ